MGNLRVITLKRILEAGENESDKILNDYARMKGLPNFSSADTYEDKRGIRLQHTRTALAGALNVLRNSNLEGLSKEQVDHYKETLAKLADIMVRFSNDKIDPYRRVKLFSRLLDLMSNNKYQIVQSAALAIFKSLEDRAKVRSDLYMRNEIYRPLAVAIGLRLKGFPGDDVHDGEMHSFIQKYFVADSRTLGLAVFSEYVRGKHSTMREFRFEYQPDDRKKYKASHSSLQLAHNWILAKLEIRNRVR